MDGAAREEEGEAGGEGGQEAEEGGGQAEALQRGDGEKEGGDQETRYRDSICLHTTECNLKKKRESAQASHLQKFCSSIPWVKNSFFTR